MGDLVRFELKKLLTRRVNIIACVGFALVLCVIMLISVTGSKTETSDGTVYAGLDAITYLRQREASHAGELTPRRVEQDVRAYQDALFERIDPAQVAGMTYEDLAILIGTTYADDPARLDMIFDDYYEELLSPWAKTGESVMQTAARVSSEDVTDFYGALSARIEQMLDGDGAAWEYTEAEKSYWLDKQAGIEAPVAKGYAGSWEQILNCLGFLVLAMAVICVALTPLFGGEYQQGTDAVILATRHGRSRLVWAKVIAGLAFTTGYFALCAAIVTGLSLAFYGADGAGLPLQNTALRSPYPLTVGQAVLVSMGVAYVMALGFAALTMLLSARLRSQLGVLAIVMVLLFVTGFVGGFGISAIIHVRYLFPLNALSASALFWSYVSYAFGPVVLDLPTMVTLTYLVATAALVPLAARGFARHQVR